MKKAKLGSHRTREIKALLEMPDDQIDTSDIRELTAEDFKHGIRGLFYRPVKQSVTIRLDADVLKWIKEQGPGYQTKINRMLRAEMFRSVIAKKGSGSVRVENGRKRTGTKNK